MKIKHEGKQEKWKLGDIVINDDEDLIAMIVKDNNKNYCLIDINPDNVDGSYSTNCCYGYPCVYLEDLQNDFEEKWHKVDATLDVKG